MRLPTLNEIETSREMVDVFKGYNHNYRIGTGEFYDMQNLTSTYYPVLSPRARRGVYETATGGEKGSLVAKDSLGYIEDGEFYLNQYGTTGLHLSADADARNTTITSMGAYVIILTRDSRGNILDKKWVNTAVGAGEAALSFGDIEERVPTPEETYVEDGEEKKRYVTTFELCGLEEDENYTDVHKGDTARELAEDEETYENGELWLDTSSKPYTLKRYSAASAQWASIATTYIKITFDAAVNCFDVFEVYDGVKIEGITEDTLSDLNASMVIWGKGGNWIKVIGMFDGLYQQTASPISISRTMPDVDFITESGNRLWGCRYGTADDGNGNTVTVNEIYASKLGDFKNWNCFMGLSTDSYAATCGTDGPFTGAVTHLGYPLFFKENCMHKVYGSVPASYQIQATACRGVQKGCSKSLAIVNEVLYYKSRSGVCAYDGSLPMEVSTALGEETYSEAVAGAYGNKYYISMKDAGGRFHLFVYDAAKGMWHREDNTQVDEFCTCRGDIYYLEHGDRTVIRTLFGSGTPDTEPVAWMAETGILGTGSPGKKYISRLNIRMQAEVGATVRFSAQYDSYGAWEPLGNMVGRSLRTFTLPIRPKRCDHLRLRIEGRGDVKIFSITKTVEEGSDV